MFCKCFILHVTTVLLFRVAYVKVLRSTTENKEYVAAVRKIHKPLEETTAEKPKDNSLLKALHFYTQEKQLKEYFCLSCNEGNSADKICSADRRVSLGLDLQIVDLFD